MTEIQLAFKLIAGILFEIVIVDWNIVDKKSRFYESHKCMIIDFMRKYHHLTNISNGDMSFILWRVCFLAALPSKHIGYILQTDMN